MKTAVLATILLLTSGEAMSHLPSEPRDDVERFTSNAAALKGLADAHLNLIEACEYAVKPLPDPEKQGFDLWRSGNSETLKAVYAWDEFADRVVAARGHMSFDEQNTIKKGLAMQVRIRTREALLKMPEDISSMCAELATKVSTARLLEDPDFQEHYKEAQKYENSARQALALYVK